MKRIALALILALGAAIAQADEYEVAAYRRVAVTLASGIEAWVYVDARHA